ncbi:MAG: hypothetical protein HZC24_05945 [Rhodocyclales bacterium]|nr:hypothetical protein [Rhodocyclales bacterium]
MPVTEMKSEKMRLQKDKGQGYNEERHRLCVMLHLTKRAERLGMQLVPIPQSA